MRRTYSVVASLTLALSAYAVYGAEQFHSTPRSGAEYYVQAHGRVPPEQLPRVYAVFDDVRNVADKSSASWPELIIVDDRKQAAAFVLADGSVVLSRRALDIVNQGVDAAAADARLAFVFGHELAHLANNDFWDSEIAQLAGNTASSSLRRALANDADRHNKELKADDLGFLYAALAGYRVDRLVRGSADAPPFLGFWMEQIGATADASYPSANTRTDLLRLRLDDRLRAIEAFSFGVRLLHFGRYTEGLALLREYQRQFPSREVFNNLGYGHLRRAVSRMPPELAYHYWLPSTADLRTPLARLATRAMAPRTRDDWRIPAAAREDLLDAIRYFELAVAKDARYAPAQINLASAQLLLGLEPRGVRSNLENLLRAESALAGALALGTNDPQLRVLSSIVRFERERIDVGSATRPSLVFDSDDPALNYNLARLHSSAPENARRFWTKALGQFDALPSRVQVLLCTSQQAELTQLVAELPQKCSEVASARTTALPWSPPVQLSRDLLESPFTESEHAKFGIRQTELARSKVFGGDGIEILAIDDITTLVVLKNPTERADFLLQCCGQPRERIVVTSGELWHYNTWIAWVREANVQEVWIAN